MLARAEEKRNEEIKKRLNLAVKEDDDALSTRYDNILAFSALIPLDPGIVAPWLSYTRYWFICASDSFSYTQDNWARPARPGQVGSWVVCLIFDERDWNDDVNAVATSSGCVAARRRATATT